MGIVCSLFHRPIVRRVKELELRVYSIQAKQTAILSRVFSNLLASPPFFSSGSYMH